MMVQGEIPQSHEAEDEECQSTNLMDMYYKKKKKKSQYAVTEAAEEAIIEKEHSRTHRKKGKKRHNSHSEDSEVAIDVESEPKSGHQDSLNTAGQRLRGADCASGSSEETKDGSVPVKVAKASHRRWVGDESDENREDAVEENPLQMDGEHCIFGVKKHKKSKRAIRSEEKTDDSAATSDQGIPDTLESALKTERRHKKLKRKKHTLEEENRNRGDDDDSESPSPGIPTSSKGQDGSNCHADHLTGQNGFDCDSVGGGDHGDKVVHTILTSLHNEMSVKKKRSHRLHECDPEQGSPDDSSSDIFEEPSLETKHKKSKHRRTVEEYASKISEDVVRSEHSDRPDKIRKKHLISEEEREGQDRITTEEDVEGHSSRKSKKKKKKMKEWGTSDELEAQQTGVLDSEREEVQWEEGNTQQARTGGLEETIRKKKHRKSSDHRTVTVSEVCPSDDCSDEREALSSPHSVGFSPAQGSEAQTRKDRKQKKQLDTEEEATLEEERADSPLDAGVELRLSTEYEMALCQLEEFIPNARSKDPRNIREIFRHDLQRFEQFKKQGIAIRYGRFTAEENELIRKNMQHYLEVTGIDAADKVTHTHRYPEEAKAIAELKRRHCLSDYIAAGIPRPYKLVMSRAQKMFDLQNYKGRYSQEETEQLIRQHATCGNNWNQISDRIGRSRLSVALKFSQVQNPVNRGAWSKEEKKKLMQAVEHLIVTSWSPEELQSMASKIEQSRREDIPLLMPEQLYKGISWADVSAKVGTRNWMQCKLKWNGILTKKMTRGAKVFRGSSALQAKIRLIQRLYESRVEDSSDLNWEELAECIGDVPPAYVQAKFYRLKARNVPSWNTKTFPEIVDHLYEETLPKFQSMLEKMKTKKATETQPETQKVFQFTDIFQDSEEDGSEPEED
ncbi:transcription termination factor 1 [Lissotriton helveticus]